MVQQPEPVTGPAPPRPPRRHRPSRTQLLVRRGIALGLLLAGLAVALWLVALAVGGLRDDPAPKPTPVAAPPTLKIIFPEGFTREQMAERINEVNAHRAREAQHQPAAVVVGVSESHGELEDPGEVRRGREAAAARRLPVPGRLPVRAEDDLAAARQSPAGGVRARLEPGRPLVCEVAKPHPVRRLDHRVPDREGGHRPRGARARGRRDLQPASPRDDVGDRRHDSLRPQDPRHGVAP